MKAHVIFSFLLLITPLLVKADAASDLIQVFNASQGKIPQLNYVKGSCDSENEHCYKFQDPTQVADILPLKSNQNEFVLNVSGGQRQVISHDQYTPASFLAFETQVDGGPLVGGQPWKEFVAALYTNEFGSQSYAAYARSPSITGLVYEASQEGHHKYLEFRQPDAKTVIFVTYPLLYSFEDLSHNGPLFCSYKKLPSKEGFCTIGYFWTAAAK